MQMPWGKHKGKDIEDIPSDYLKWVAENSNSENERLAVAADEEWDFRERTNSHVYED